jgi:uncharacterized protein (DUF433 family)
MPPRGHYLAHEVGLLAGVSGDRIGQWARRGYIRSSQHTGSPRVYSYQDVAEAMVVHELEDAGAGLKSIKRTIERLRERQGMDWPLQHHGALATVHGIVVEHDGFGSATNLGGAGSEAQTVMTDENLRKIAGQLERGGWAVRSLPDLQHIEVNPDRLSGRPVIRGLRVAASMVAELAERPEGVEILREDFELGDAQINDARRWWRATAKFEQIAA